MVKGAINSGYQLDRQLIKMAIMSRIIFGFSFSGKKINYPQCHELRFEFLLLKVSTFNFVS